GAGQTRFDFDADTLRFGRAQLRITRHLHQLLEERELVLREGGSRNDEALAIATARRRAVRRGAALAKRDGSAGSTVRWQKLPVQDVRRNSAECKINDKY